MRAGLETLVTHHEGRSKPNIINNLTGIGMHGIHLLHMCFYLSFDDFIITNFNSGVVSTFPKFVYVSAARGIPAQANVIGSAMFFIALIIVIVGQVVARKRKKI